MNVFSHNEVSLCVERYVSGWHSWPSFLGFAYQQKMKWLPSDFERRNMHISSSDYATSSWDPDSLRELTFAPPPFPQSAVLWQGFAGPALPLAERMFS